MAPRFVGFTTFEGELYPLISQRDAIGQDPTDEQTLEDLTLRGFVEVFETGAGMSKAHALAVAAGLKPTALTKPNRIGSYNPSTGIWLEGVHDENARVAPNGAMLVFDPVVYFVAPTVIPAASVDSSQEVPGFASL